MSRQAFHKSSESLALNGYSLSFNRNWINARITGRNITSFAFSGDNVFVGIRGDVFGSLRSGHRGGIVISNNNGQSWRDLSPLMPAENVNALLVKGRNLFAATDQGLLVSADNGLSWGKQTEAIGAQRVWTLATMGDTILAGAAEGSSPRRTTDEAGNCAAFSMSRSLRSPSAARGSSPLKPTPALVRSFPKTRAKPGQTFVETAEGEARIAVVNGDGQTSTGTVRIARVAPGLFTANGNGQGVAGGFVLRIKANGEQVYESPSRFDSTQNRFVPAPIDVSSPNEQVFLALFGTGLRNHNGLPSVSVKLGGVELPVLYAGAQNDFAGLDQINVRLPNTLAGRGELSLELTVEGKRANSVTVGIK